MENLIVFSAILWLLFLFNFLFQTQAVDDGLRESILSENTLSQSTVASKIYPKHDLGFLTFLKKMLSKNILHRLGLA
jgi:hypothetical protein